MNNTIIALLATAALIAPQSGFKDPGPPPVSAAPVPTMNEAKTFIEEMTKRFGVVSCKKVNKQNNSRGELSLTTSSMIDEYQIIALTLDKAIIELRSIHEINSQFASEPSEVSSAVIEKRNISEFSLADTSVTLFSAEGYCKPFHYIKFSCNSGSCTSLSIQELNKETGEPIKKDNISTMTGGAMLFFEDRSMAERVLKAIQFYKDNMGDVAKSPF